MEWAGGVRHRDPEGPQEFTHSENLKIFIDHNEVEGEQHMPMVCTALAGQIHTPLSGCRDLLPSKRINLVNIPFD